MFSIRVHSLDSPHAGDDQTSSLLGGDAAGEAAGTSRNTNSRLQLLRGTVHLYRDSSPPSTSSSNPLQPSPTSPLIPAGRGTRLLILAVPSRLSPEDFFRFCGSYVDRATAVKVIRDERIEDRYCVLVEFDDQKSADAFYLDLNGWRFSTEGEICHVLFVYSVEYTESAKIAGTPQIGSTELPTCPVCIERLDQDISGIIATTCDHSFQCSCISKWVNSSCLVCQYSQKHSEKPTCLICGTSENLWICVICGFVGCGRYKEGHAIRHWKDTQHCYSLDLETQRVWDYVGDNYVHRLNQSRSDDDKMAKSKFTCQSVGDSCLSCGCSDDSGISGALLSSKIEAIVDEYNRLLASQLESQKQYYEALLEEAKENRKKYISEAVEKAVNSKMQDIRLELMTIDRENKILDEINENLRKNQDFWRKKIEEIEERESTTLRLKDTRIRDLEEEIRDFTVFIETQKTLNTFGGDDVRGGTVLPVPSPSPSTKTRRSKLGRKRS